MRHSRPGDTRRISLRRSLALVLVAAVLVAASTAAGCSFASGSEGATEASDPSNDATAQDDGDSSSDEDAPVSGSQTVPNVVGSDVAAAREAMDDAGLHTRLRWVFSTSGFRTVLDQTRVAGESASAGSWVELMVSLGPAPPAPSPVVLPASAYAAPSSPAPSEQVVEVYPTTPSTPPPSTTVAPSPAPEPTSPPTDPTPVSDVPRGPMEPTIDETETVSYDGDAYVADAPRVGDVVVFGADEGMGQALRVVGVAGDSVRIAGGRVERNGALMDEPYVVYGLDSSYTMEAATTVPDGKVFMVGDNRAALALYDWGLIAVDSIDGKAVFE